jgi:hypothetical protein
MTANWHGFAVIFQKSRMECAAVHNTFRFAFWGGFQRRQRLLWPEESKETGGFVAGNPTGTASPWHTTLHEVRQRRTSESDCLQSPSEASERRSRLMAGIAKYSVLYLRPRLTGKRSVSMQERSFCLAGKRAGFCEWERAET